MALILGLLVAALLLFNVLTYRQLVRIHPRRKPFAIAAIVIGNLMWPFFPMLNARTDFSRAVRATLGPAWFGWASFTILYALLLLALLVAWLPFVRRTSFARFARWPSRIFIAMVIVGGLAGFYEALVPLRIERVPVAIDGLPPELEGKKIALLADFHVGLYTRPNRLTQFFAATSALRPDVTILAGDLIDDDPYFIPKLLEGTRALDPRIPLMAVLGNHEMYGVPLEVIGRLRGSRIRLLVNEGAPLGKLWIAGISDYAARLPRLKPDFGAALANMPPGSMPLVVSHQPRSFDEARARRLPLTLCAHTHGGQLGFRPLGWSLAGLFLPYHMGLYERGPSQLYVNTGTGFWLLPFRLGMTPEITLIELRRRRPLS